MANTIRPPRSTRILRWLIGLAVLIAIGWTALWFGAAAWVEDTFDERVAALKRDGRADIVCGRHGVHGFPFAFRFACDEDVMVETMRADVALVGITAGTSIVSPSSVTADLEGPANVAFAPGRTLRADWRSATGVVGDLFGRRRFTIDLDALDLDLSGTDLKAATYDAALAPEGADLKVVSAATDIVLTFPGRDPARVPALQVDVQLQGLHRRLVQEGRPFEPRNGLVGTVDRLRIDAEDGGRVFVSGPFEVSPEGRLSGRFTIAVAQPDALARLAASFVPDTRAVAGALTALGTLGERREIEGVEMRALELQAVDGRLPLGFITLDLPQIWQRPAGG